MQPPAGFQVTPADYDADDPRLAIRRHTDRCFFRVEELVAGPGLTLAGFVVEGVMIDPDDVAEVRRTAEGGGMICDGGRVDGTGD